MSKARILVVEDENIVSLDVCSSLQMLGYSVAGQAVSGEDAVLKAEKNQPDLILMDIHLKGSMNGIEAAQVIWQRFSLPIIFLTAFTDQETLEQARLAEPYGYLIKPFQEHELDSVITIALYKHQIEQNLKRLHLRYRGIAEDMPALVCRFLPDGILTFVNQQFCRYFDKTEEELVGGNFYQFIPESERLWVSMHYRALTPDKPVVTYDHQVMAPNGGLRWQRWSGRAIFDDQKRLMEYQSLGEDITDRRQAEEALRNSEAKFRNIIQQSQDGFILTDEKGLVIEWNAAMQKMSGFPASEMLHKPVEEVQLMFLPSTARNPERLESIRASVSQALNTGEAPWLSRVIEGYLEHPDGTLRHIQSLMFPVRTQSGVMLGAINRDITDQRHLEDQIRLQSAALDAAANAIVITDVRGNIAWVNPAFTRLTGFTQQEALGQNPRILKTFHQPADFYQSLWSTIMSGQVWRGELINRRKDGTEYYEEMTITPVTRSGFRDGQPVISHFVAVKQDISERKRAELAIARRLELERAVAEIGATFVQSTDLQQSMTYVLTCIGEVFRASRTAIFLADYETNRISSSIQWHNPSLQEASGYWKNFALSDYDWMLNDLQTKGLIAFDDTQTDDTTGFDLELMASLSIRSAIILPLIIDNSVLGVFIITSVEPRSWQRDDIDLLKTVVGLLSSAMQRFRAEAAERQARKQIDLLYQEALQLSITDPLTGLYNRRYFYECALQELQRLQRHGHSFSIIIFDVDLFKLINDRYGHLAGDKVLMELAQLVKSNLRGMDVLARFGGEEFIILLPQTSLPESRVVAERLCRETDQMLVRHHGQDIHITISMGVTCAALEGGSSSVPELEVILNRADQALYAAKASGRNKVCLI
jgi:diguanylate cyclase (GGDEF)-like protein/PAS domain S-box-containing protein